MVKNRWITIGLLIVLMVLFQWLTDFQFFYLEDLRLLVILLTGTGIFMLLHKDRNGLASRFRVYLFLMAFLMSLLMVYGTLLTPEESVYRGLMSCLRPIMYAILIYFPGNIIILQLPEDKEEERPWQELLSRRETEVYNLITQGKTNREISEELYIAETTVKKHVQNIMKKAGHNDRQRL